MIYSAPISKTDIFTVQLL